MTPPQSTGFAAPTDESVAGLVARLTERWESTDAPVAKKVDRLLAVCREAATALSTLAAELKTTHKARAEATSEWVMAEDDANALRASLEASEARATALEAERDEWKEATRRAGVCMSCAVGLPPETYGCTDCLNTGWNGGAPVGFVAEAQLARAIEALEPFAEYAETEDDFDLETPDHMQLWPTFTVGDFRRARAARDVVAPADGRGGHQMLASASCPQEPSNEVHEVGRDDLMRRAKRLLVNKGWKPGDQMSAHSVNGLMVELAIDAVRNPPDRCAYPECGCDFDAVCNEIAALGGSGPNLADAKSKDLPSKARADGVKYGPYRVKWLGAGVWAGITDELPAELEGRDVMVIAEKQNDGA